MFGFCEKQSGSCFPKQIHFFPFAGATNNSKLWMIPAGFPRSCFEIPPFPYKLKPKGFQVRTQSLKGLPGSLTHPSAPPHNLPHLPFTCISGSNPVLAFALQASLLYLLETFFSPISRLNFFLATSFLSVATPVFSLELFSSPSRCLIFCVGNRIKFQHETILFPPI